MFWIITYFRGHQLNYILPITWCFAVLAYFLGHIPLPLPTLHEPAPPVTLDAIFSLVIAAAIMWSLTTPLAWFEENSALRARWRTADVLSIIVLASPAFAVSTLASSAHMPSMLNRDIAVYLLVMLPLAALWSVEAAILTSALWLPAQAAFYGINESWFIKIITVIMDVSPTSTTFYTSLVVLVGWCILARRIKLRTA